MLVAVQGILPNHKNSMAITTASSLHSKLMQTSLLHNWLKILQDLHILWKSDQNFEKPHKEKTQWHYDGDVEHEQPSMSFQRRVFSQLIGWSRSVVLIMSHRAFTGSDPLLMLQCEHGFSPYCPYWVIFSQKLGITLTLPPSRSPPLPPYLTQTHIQ